MSNIDKQAVTEKTKELASLMVERFSMNPVSCKLLNEAWEKEFPDEVAIAERMLALLDELEHYKSREERVTKLVLDNSTSWDALYKKLEAAEKRIAEHLKVLNSLAAVARRYLPDYDEHPEFRPLTNYLRAPLASRLRGSEMTKILRKNYPRQSRFKEALFFLLFLILMVPISPISFIWLAGVQAEKIAEWYSSIVWGPFNKLHNKLNPYREG